MEANMSGLKRCLNKAVVECKREASFTARRLVGQIKTINRRPEHSSAIGRQNKVSGLANTSLSCSSSKLSRELGDGRQEVGRFSGSLSTALQCSSAESHPSRAPFSANCQITYHQDDAHFDQYDKDDKDEDKIGAPREQQQMQEQFSSSGSEDEQRDETTFVANHNNHNLNLNRAHKTTTTPSNHITPSPSSSSSRRHHSPSTRMAPNSLKTTISTSNFVRCSALNSSSSRMRRGSSRRRRQGARCRQVRFQPIPQSIDISNHQEDEEEEEEKLPIEEKTSISIVGSNARGCGRLKAITLKPPTKTITNKIAQLSAKTKLSKRLHNLSHMKFNKIKLKSFNNLIHQTLTSTYATSESFNPMRTGSAVFRATDNPLNNNTKGNVAVQQHQYDEEEEFGWGSDFDEQSVDSSLNGGAQATFANSADAYLLEIGKSSSDLRAIEDVIQDQGLSGQFKPLHSSPRSDNSAPDRAEIKVKQQQYKIDHKLRIELERRQQELIKREQEAEQQQQQQPDRQRRDNEAAAGRNEAQDEEDEDDDEAELRSLEARQGFKQIRDKLKVILDQRLADYEAASCAPGGAISAKINAAAAAIKVDNFNGGQLQANLSPDKRQALVIEAQERESCKTMSQLPVGATELQFDCQSHCSDESSSSGLDSNHSGSQDSGHSTQHSGYSTHCHHHRAAAIDPPSSIETPSLAATSGESECGSVASPTGSGSGSGDASAKPLEREAKTKVAGVLVDSEEAGSEERRMRFIQNRLIINNKLESMFRSRSGSCQPVIERASSNGHFGQPNSASSIQQLSAIKSNNDIADCDGGRGKQLIESNYAAEESMLTRSKLLEQQRQMSLKLKQKPRRKTAKRALAGSGASAAQSVATANVDTNTDDNGSYASTSSELGQPLAQLPAPRGAFSVMPVEESLTKQLSMICLRQAGQLSALASQQGISISNCSGSSISSNGNSGYLSNNYHKTISSSAIQPIGLIPIACSQPRPAQSLRQLVKDVIDDCERPGKLSTLTMSILNRSDSFSSDLALSSSTVSNIGEASSSSSSGGSINNSGNSNSNSNSNSNNCNNSTSNNNNNSNICNNNSSSSNNNHNYIISSSASTKVNSGKQFGAAFVQHFVTISNRKWKSCHLRSSLMQTLSAFNSHGNSSQDDNESPLKKNLAYLDDSRNFSDDV